MKRSTRIFVYSMLVTGMVIAGVLPAGAAPAVATSSGGSDDLRAALATPQDIAEGKRVAEASCASCHGMNGIAKAKGTPHIAGQRPAYLYLELRVYQTGARGNTPMNNAVRFLSDDALVKVAAYYANLDPAQPAASGSAKAAPAKPDRSAPARPPRLVARAVMARPGSASCPERRTWSGSIRNSSFHPSRRTPKASARMT